MPDPAHASASALPLAPISPVLSAPASTERVVRPDPGLGSGRYEASRLSIGILAGALVLAFILFLALKVRRARKLKRGGVGQEASK